MRYVIIFLMIYLMGPLYLWLTGKIDFKANYQTADRNSANIAPAPSQHPQAIVQFYAARAFNWRGMFAVHTWIAVKSAHADYYEVFQVIGWRAMHGLPVIVMEKDVPDRSWFNSKPSLLVDIRGPNAQLLIPKIRAAARSYPYPQQYAAWPGPNSNTFTAYVARAIPQLQVALPTNALGKDYLGRGIYYARAPSNTGWQLSINGVLGILLAKKEGLEINIGGLVLGLNPFDLAISLPGVGRIGF